MYHYYIDQTGKMIIDTKQLGISQCYSFAEGLACIVKDEKYGYMDNTGEIVIEPRFDYAYSFSGELAYVKINNETGYIDKEGHIVSGIKTE